MADYPDELRELVDEYLAGLEFSSVPATAGLVEAMRYSLLAGGKRVRPVLCLASARSAGAEPETVLPAAAAIELIHTYSLIHDDLPAMDDDELRRGRPTSHVKYGEDVAILAGDGLFAEAIRLVCDRQEGEPQRVLAALAELTAATGVGGMVGGQYVDVTQDSELDAERLRKLHALKTGRLIAASVLVPLLLAGVDEAATIPYRHYAEELGVLFQIVDDILDVTGSDAELGKPHGSDERHGKLTYVSLFGLDRARELAALSHEQARRGARRDRRRHRRPRADHRLHPHPSNVSDEQRTSTAPPRLGRRPRRPEGPRRRAARSGRAGGARGDHRHDRRDRRPLRRQPRHLRADHGPARAARLADATRSSGTSATRPTRTRSSPAAATGSRRSASTRASRRSARSPSPSTTSWAPATPRPRSATPSASRRRCATGSARTARSSR